MNRALRILVLAALLGAGAAVRAACAAPAATPAVPARVEADSVRLALAATAERRDDPRAVIDQLERIDFAAPPAFAGADRAAFLLGAAYLRVGAADRLVALARAVERWPAPTPYTRWLAIERRVIESARGAGVPGDTTGPFARDPDAGALAASGRLRAGDLAGALGSLGTPPPGTLLSHHVTSLAREALGVDDAGALAVVARGDTATALDRDLVGSARLRLAARARAAGATADADAWLAGVPAGSRYAARSRHLLGLAALERGDVARGRALLEGLLASDSGYVARREVELALAGAALDEARWDDAQRGYAGLDRDWTAARDTLRRRLADGAFDDLWSGWTRDPQLSGALVLDADATLAAAARQAAAAADLDSTPAVVAPPLAAPASEAGPRVAIEPPPAEAWAALAVAAGEAAAARDEQVRTRRAADDERAALADRARFLGGGRARLGAEDAWLAARAARLDSLRGRLDAVDQALRAVRDGAAARVAERTAALRAAAAGAARWSQAMRRFHVDGPDSARVRRHPPGLPAPDSVLDAEDALLGALTSAVDDLAGSTPERLRRSYAEAWRPTLIDRAAAEDSAAARGLAWTRALGATLDSSLAACADSPRRRALDARAATLAASADSLDAVTRALRDTTARAAVARALAALDDEREPIDYGLAASAYALAVDLAARDTAATSPVARLGGRPAAAGADADSVDDPRAAAWRARAIPLLEGFLADHPRSPARADLRFRLADLELVQARQDFRGRMAAFLRDTSAGRARRALPVLDPSRALALYRALLAEDPDFPHRDAVLFDAGMILADQGDVGARAYFDSLVAGHPDSPYGQEAWLRMGDMAFDERRFAASVPLYAHAATGPDPTLRVIADYKRGWAHFDEDQFFDAADAFREALDLYASPERARIGVEIEGESEAWLVQSLAGAGGADSCAVYFDRIGHRPYERRVLMALGQHLRRYGGFAQAVRADEQVIARFPDDPDALLAAGRLVETWHRAGRADDEQRARLALAPRFAPGGDWARAQAADSVRAAGARFARDSWLAAAATRHARARADGDSADWREARRLYELVLDRFPADSLAPALELDAGEASARLLDYPGALRHDAAAAAAGDDSTARRALWERVAVTDAWYTSTRRRVGRDSLTLGRDSLARAVIDAGDALLARAPRDPRGADVVWRQSQLALAHGWDERALADLGALAGRWPDDPRAPLAALQRGDALYRRGEFAAAGAAFEAAVATAHRAGRDSLERRAAAAVPVCYYRAVEAAVAADSSRWAEHARGYEQVATRWPTFPQAALAQYRAGLAYGRAGEPREEVRALQALVASFPRSPYVREARLQVAHTWEDAGEREAAAAAYLDFAAHHPDDESAGAAQLKAADLLAAAGQVARADTLRLAYVRLHPGDVETGMQVYESLARRTLDAVSPEHPVSALLGPPARGRRVGPPASPLAEYLRRAAAHPALASKDVIARVRFLQAEEALPAYAAARLTQPLPRSIAVRQRLLDTLLVRYRRAADVGVATWAHAAAFRIGEALAGFGDALAALERPADLSGDDRRAYDEVLGAQARTFAERGEAVWTTLLRQAHGQPGDAWTERAQQALFPRLAARFLFRPEAAVPLIDGDAPAPPHADAAPARAGQRASRAHAGRALAGDEGSDR